MNQDKRQRRLAAAMPLLLIASVLAVGPAEAEVPDDLDALLAQLQQNLDLAGALMETDDPIAAARLATAWQAEAVAAMAENGVATEADVHSLLEQRLQNLDLAESIVAEDDAVAVAKLATAWQAATLGVALESALAPQHDAPSRSVQALLERHGVVPTEYQWAQIAALDDLPTSKRSALAGIVDAFLALEDATRIAYQDADLEALTALAEDDPQELAGGATSLVDAGVHVGLILGTRNDFLDATQAFQEAFGDMMQPTAASSQPGIDLCPAIALDLDGIDTTYNDNCALVLDVGGHDTYLNNAGGSKLIGGPDDCGLPNPHAAAALVDLAGDDEYASGGQCGHNGGGQFGVGFLLDQAGDDSYTAGASGTNGGGSVGVGFLMDQAGSDTYTADWGGTNGGGWVGVGFLLDQAGDDSYIAGGSGTNGGGSGPFAGVGFLLDQSGNDTYDGDNGGGSGGTIPLGVGVGFLMDQSGDDTYYGKNGGGNTGVGFLLDQAGDDFYHAPNSLATNGGGTVGIGLLFDASGTDGYQVGNGPIALDQTIVPKGTGAQVDTQTPAQLPGGTIVKVKPNTDGSTTVYLDLDGDDEVDGGEEVLTTPLVGHDAGCDPVVPGLGDALTCWAWVEVNGARVIDEEEVVQIPSEPVIDQDAGCTPTAPGPGDTVTCWAWIEVDGQRVVDQEHTQTVPAEPTIDHDAGCNPATPGPGDTVTCHAWVEVDGVRVIDETHTQAIPAVPEFDHDAGCTPTAPGPGDTVTCWAWVEINGDRVIDEEEDVTVPSQPVVDHDAGCSPTNPGFGDTVTCWAWVEVDGDRVIDEERSQEFPGGGSQTTEKEFLHEDNVTVTPSQDVPPEDQEGTETPDYPGTDPVPTPDYPGTDPEPTPDYPGTDPVPTPGAGERVATVTVRDEGDLVCVDVTPEGDEAIPVTCLDRDRLGPADGHVPRGDTPIVYLGEEETPDVPGTDPEPVPDVPGTDPEPVPDVPGTDPEPVPDAPPIPGGSVGTTPHVTVTLDVSYRYDATRLNHEGSFLGTDVWSPAGPGHELWYLTSGDDVGMTVTLSVYEDGEHVATVPVLVPYLGQALAAAEMSAGTL